MTLDIAIQPGSASEQILRVGSGPNAAELPVKVIKGKADGPVFSIIAGIHGYEYPPIIATQQIENKFVHYSRALSTDNLVCFYRQVCLLNFSSILVYRSPANAKDFANLGH
ncbi:hypothetical protein [Dyadobacter chenhuakuii]|uniref:Succinylglutamate desuccinylase/aspartoacylase family protein n=1 Tax=Dyadobacter chenhuakuii TaxID=2909339 RepID=A0ABY5E737_9BACT|nr:hypothetical protein [Dyadobacter chenhuakuii]UTM21768.1 hypothetical protein NFI80_25165 [Dyadobacter chenhuakuii]